MFKKFLMAAGVVAAFAFPSQGAQAKVNVIIGTPGYNYCYNHYDRFRCGGYGYFPHRGFYDPYPPFYDDGYPPRYDYDRISCSEARQSLRERGYRNIRTRSCDGRYYVFVARKHHQTFLIKVSSRSGAIRSVRPI